MWQRGLGKKRKAGRPGGRAEFKQTGKAKLEVWGLEGGAVRRWSGPRGPGVNHVHHYSPADVTQGLGHGPSALGHELHESVAGAWAGPGRVAPGNTAAGASSCANPPPARTRRSIVQISASLASLARSPLAVRPRCLSPRRGCSQYVGTAGTARHATRRARSA